MGLGHGQKAHLRRVATGLAAGFADGCQHRCGVGLEFVVGKEH